MVVVVVVGVVVVVVVEVVVGSRPELARSSSLFRSIAW